METITIPSSEYEALKGEVARLNQQVQWLMEQMRLSKHRQYGASSEKSSYEQLSLFNEAEATADANVAEPELVEVERHYRKKKRESGDRVAVAGVVALSAHELAGGSRARCWRGVCAAPGRCRGGAGAVVADHRRAGRGRRVR